MASPAVTTLSHFETLGSKRVGVTT